jgi:hypothetical protein
VPGGDDLEADVAHLALETAGPENQHPPYVGLLIAQVERRGPRRADDPIGADGTAHRPETRHVIGAVVHRVVRDVDDVVALGRPVGEDGRDTRHGVSATVDDAVEIDEEEHRAGS